jgi:hypothetical protein
MKFLDILNEQDSENNKSSSWTREEIGIMNTLIKKGFEDTEPSEIKKFLNKLGYDKEESIDLFYLFKNNVSNGEFDINELPDRERHWEDFEPKQIALAIFLDLDPSEVEESQYSHYGLTEYDTPEGNYAIGTDHEADRAAEESARGLIDDGAMNEDYAKDYITMSDTDRRLYAQEEADMIVDDMDDDDIIREKDLEDEIDEIDSQESENRDKIDELETEIEDLESELEDLDANDDSERIEEINKLVLHLESQKEGLENIDYDERKEEIIERGREELREEKYDEIYDELDDPVEYFVENRGIYTLTELIKNGPVFLDEDKMVSDMVSDDGRGNYLSSYDGDENEQEYDGITYYIYRTN